MAFSGSSRKGSGSPGWLRTSKYLAILATILVLLGATDLPGSDSLKRLVAASGLYADTEGAPFPRPERRSLSATTKDANVAKPLRTNERPKLTPEEEKRRQEVIKIYEEAKAEAAKEEKRKVAREAATAKRLEAERREKASKKAAEKAARKDLAGGSAEDGSDREQGDAKLESGAGDSKAEDRKDDRKESAGAQNGKDSATSGADAEEKQQKQSA